VLIAKLLIPIQFIATQHVVIRLILVEIRTDRAIV